MAFTFKLEHPDGTPGDPPTLRSAVPNWETGLETRANPHTKSRFTIRRREIIEGPGVRMPS